MRVPVLNHKHLNPNGLGVLTMTIPVFTLNNGVTMPALGLGVFQSPPDQTQDAVTTALGLGYRHIDTAAAYGNERQVGEAIATSGLARHEVFIETKVWISDYGFDQTLHAFDTSAGKLGLEQRYEKELHGVTGFEQVETSAGGRAVRKLGSSIS